MMIDGIFGEDIYTKKKNEFEEKEVELREKLQAIKQWDTNILNLIENLCELVENLYGSYKNGDDEKKGEILQAMQCELIINEKKELSIQESPLFSMIKDLRKNNWRCWNIWVRTFYEFCEYILCYWESVENTVQELKRILSFKEINPFLNRQLIKKCSVNTKGLQLKFPQWLHKIR